LIILWSACLSHRKVKVEDTAQRIHLHIMRAAGVVLVLIIRADLDFATQWNGYTGVYFRGAPLIVEAIIKEFRASVWS